MKKFLRFFGAGKRKPPAIDVTPPVNASVSLPEKVVSDTLFYAPSGAMIQPPKNLLQEPKVRTFNLLEIAEYNIDFRVMQNPEKEWVYCLEFYPHEAAAIIGNDDEIIEGLGKINRIKDVQGVLIYGRDCFTQWEYAAEAAIDIVELIGFVVDKGTHVFDILHWDAKTDEHEVSTGVYDGIDFSIIDEEE